MALFLRQIFSSERCCSSNRGLYVLCLRTGHLLSVHARRPGQHQLTKIRNVSTDYGQINIRDGRNMAAATEGDPPGVCCNHDNRSLNWLIDRRRQERDTRSLHFRHRPQGVSVQPRISF